MMHSIVLGEKNDFSIYEGSGHIKGMGNLELILVVFFFLKKDSLSLRNKSNTKDWSINIQLDLQEHVFKTLG